ncbi:hypothetical protein Tco_1202196 [Tanacetum coccineum]
MVERVYDDVDGGGEGGGGNGVGGDVVDVGDGGQSWMAWWLMVMKMRRKWREERKMRWRLGTMAGVDVNTLTVKQYLALLLENQASGVVKPEIRGNVNFEIKSQFMRELREDTFSGKKDEDAQDHIDHGSQKDMPRLNKDFPFNEEVKTSSLEGLDIGEFGRTTPFNGSNKGKFRCRPLGYREGEYWGLNKIIIGPPYGEKEDKLRRIIS